MTASELLRRWFAGQVAPCTLGLCLLAPVACGGSSRVDRESVIRSGSSADSMSRVVVPESGATQPAPATPIVNTTDERRLRPLADSIAQRLVFAPLGQDWFAAASRAGRLVVDLGRVDFDLKDDPARRAAFQQAAEARSPFPVGTQLRLRGVWGDANGTIAGFDAWNGRIVATLHTSALVDSLARTTDPFVVAARRGGQDETQNTVAAPSCDRTSDSTFSARLIRVARAVEDSLRTSVDQPVYPRLKSLLRARRSTARGCFGSARGVVIVTLYAGDYEWVRERVLLVSDSSVTKATVRDLRFRAHEALQAFDADGDGLDDLAARAWTPRGGGTVILKLGDGARFDRLAAGFAWER